MAAVELLVTDHLDLWTAAIKRRSTAGRGSSSKIELYGIKKLRELILELAVRGLLVPQDSDDEPASALLKKITAKKAKLLKEGKIRKEKTLRPIGDEERPFSLPRGWEFRRLGEILTFEYGVNLPDARRSGTGEFPVYGSNGVVGSHNESFVAGQCIVIGRKGSAGALNLCLENGCCVTDVAYYCIPPSDLSVQFVFKMLHTLGLDSLGKGIKPGLNRNEAYVLVVPIPPLAEQHRIVAKVGELMALCDQLERQTDASLRAQETLAEILLNALTNAADHAQFVDAWQRVAEHFNTLFVTEKNITQLKQTILQLAVMGKLVPQDSNDEPANELLRMIATENARLVKEGKIKKINPLTPITEEEKPFELPKAWAWSRFDGLIDPEYQISYGVLVPGPEVEDGIPFVRIEDLSLKNPTEQPNKKISAEIDQQFARTRLVGGEILMGVVGSIGKLGIAPESWRGANIARAVCRIVPTKLLNRQYVIQILQSNFMQKSFIGDTRTLAQPTLNIGFIRNTLTPVPPLSEQHRIVVKVDELMDLCDQLKSRLNDAQATQLDLADALTETALAGG